jgi:hypothetical protein
MWCRLLNISSLPMTNWKGSLLSIMGRVQLVKLTSMIKNFIWSGDVNHKKICTVSWNKACKPLYEGGLGLIKILKTLILHPCFTYVGTSSHLKINGLSLVSLIITFHPLFGGCGGVKTTDHLFLRCDFFGYL